MAARCQHWLPNKRRHCANAPLTNSGYCGNHDPSSGDQRVPCPVDPSHSVFKSNLESHVKRCPCLKQAQVLESQPYYSKGINGGGGGAQDGSVSSAAKRRAIHGFNGTEFIYLLKKIRGIHTKVALELRDSFAVPDACDKWLRQQLDRQVPYQEKHVVQQASILGNMEKSGILRAPVEEDPMVDSVRQSSDELNREEVKVPAVVEFGAGRGYLTQMLADCYGINKVFLVERRSYKLKADRSLRQIKDLVLERLRIDIEDLNLSALESLRGLPHLAIGKHLCGPATDLTIRCCFPEKFNRTAEVLLTNYLEGLALATCCHHLCQWDTYINTSFFSNFGVTKEEFHAMTWLSSWAVDADHSSDLSHVVDQEMDLIRSEKEEALAAGNNGIEGIMKTMPVVERAALGFMCKEIIDVGRTLWLRENGLDAQLVKYVPVSTSPENHLLVAKCRRQL